MAVRGSRRIRELKVKHGLKPNLEIKWNKVSNSKFDFYKDVVDLFFDVSELGYRAIIIPDKSSLDHAKYDQTFDEFYYFVCEFFSNAKAEITPR